MRYFLQGILSGNHHKFRAKVHMYCNQCQLVHGEEQRFCQRCGQLLKPAPAGATRACARCGALTYPGQKFCTECGLPLRTMAAGREDFAPQTQAPLFYPRGSESRSRQPRRRRPGLAVTLVGLVVLLIVGIYGWRQLVSRPKLPEAPITVAPQEDIRREVERLAEKIRAAHLNKDINKWLSCYAPNYPNLGKVESQILELWKNFDVREVSYRISNVQRQSERSAGATIIWNIQVFDHRTQDYTLLRPGYRITLEKRNGDWKIRDSREEAG